MFLTKVANSLTNDYLCPFINLVIMKLPFTIPEDYTYQTQQFLKKLLFNLRRDPAVSKLDEEAFALLGNVHNRFVEADEIVTKEGLIILDKHGASVTHPAVKIRHDEQVKLLKLMLEFGLTPKSRFKQGKKPKEKETNPIDLFLKKTKKIEIR
jgi:P27 family predicted phage terminase small subunit